VSESDEQRIPILYSQILEKLLLAITVRPILHQRYERSLIMLSYRTGRYTSVPLIQCHEGAAHSCTANSISSGGAVHPCAAGFFLHKTIKNHKTFVIE
jgi:hypothetical protein